MGHGDFSKSWGQQTLIVEFVGPEEKIQELLERLEKIVEGDEGIEIKAVTIRKN